MLAVTLRSISDAVIATDIEGRVTLVNQIAEQFTGWPRSEAIGQPLSAVFHVIDEKSRELCGNSADKVLEKGTIIGFANPTLLIARDGTERSIANRAAPIRDRSSNVIGAVIMDLTISGGMGGQGGSGKNSCHG